MDVLLVRDSNGDGDGCRSIRSADDGDDTVRSFRIILTGAWVDFPRSLALHTVPDCNLRIRFREKRIPHGYIMGGINPALSVRTAAGYRLLLNIQNG